MGFHSLSRTSLAMSSSSSLPVEGRKVGAGLRLSELPGWGSECCACWLASLWLLSSADCAGGRRHWASSCLPCRLADCCLLGLGVLDCKSRCCCGVGGSCHEESIGSGSRGDWLADCESCWMLAIGVLVCTNSRDRCCCGVCCSCIFGVCSRDPGCGCIFFCWDCICICICCVNCCVNCCCAWN